MSEHTFKLMGSIYSPIKGEDVMRIDTSKQGDVFGVAMVIDGATGMKKRILDNGEEVTLGNIVSGTHTPARVWSDLLRDSMIKGAYDADKSLMTVIQEATAQASEKFPAKAGNAFPAKLDALQIPSAAVLLTRIRNGQFEVCSNGDCGIVIRYEDGKIETYTGNKVLDDMRTARDAQIIADNPGFNEKSKEEQGKIRYRYMQQTKEAWGSKYFTPYLGGAANMERFKQVTDNVTDDRKTLTTYAGGMMWTLSAPANKIHSILMFSDGVDPAFKDSKIVEEIMNAQEQKEVMKTVAILSRLNALLQTDEHAAAVQGVNNANGTPIKKKPPVFDDRAAWLLRFTEHQK